MRVIYVAGAYSSKTEWGLVENIRDAERVARRLWLEGWAVICPHKNTAHFGGLLDNPVADHNFWIEGDLEILKRCDAIYMTTGWESSKGSKKELELAKELGLEIFFE